MKRVQFNIYIVSQHLYIFKLLNKYTTHKNKSYLKLILLKYWYSGTFCYKIIVKYNINEKKKVTRKEKIVFERNKTRFETIEENPDFCSVCVVHKKK